MVSTQLHNVSQIGPFPQTRVKILETTSQVKWAKPSRAPRMNLRLTLTGLASDSIVYGSSFSFRQSLSPCHTRQDWHPESKHLLEKIVDPPKRITPNIRKQRFQVQPFSPPSQPTLTPCRQWSWATRRPRISHHRTRCLPPVSLLCTLREPKKTSHKPTTYTGQQIQQ